MREGCQRPLALPAPLFSGCLDLSVLETQRWRWKPAPSPLATLSASFLLAAGPCLLVTSLLITQTLLPHDLCLVGTMFLSHNMSFLSHFPGVQLSSDSCQTASRWTHSLRFPRLPYSCTSLTIHFFRVRISSPSGLPLFGELVPLGNAKSFLQSV